MAEGLDSIEMLLRRALNLTKQGSYNRRAPSGESVPLLARARSELESWVLCHGRAPQALRLLALANEAMLNYDEAAELLEEVVKLSPRPDRKDLKRLAACREACRGWRGLGLDPEELAALGSYLHDKLLDCTPERSLRWTRNWLKDNKPYEADAIINALRSLGHFSDYLILHNLVPG